MRKQIEAKELDQKQINLYFNCNYPSGFDICEKIKSPGGNILYRPVNQEDGLIYSRISQQGQNYVLQHIKLYNFVINSLNESQNQIQSDQTQENNLTQVQQVVNKDLEKEFINNQTINPLLNQIVIYPSENAIILRQQIDKQIFEFQQVNDDSVTFCLIYDGQKMQEIDHQINNFKKIFNTSRSINIVIVINGQENLKKYNLDKNFEIQQNINENKCNICYSFEYKDCIFLIISEEQSQIKLLNWIYSGIFKHFQPEYFYVGYLSIIVDADNFRQMDDILRSSNEYCGATGHYNLISGDSQFKYLDLNNSIVGYMNFLNYQFQIDSLFSFKRFHNPFFSYYKWNSCYKYLDQYLKDLEKNTQEGNINLYLNSLFPSLMYEKEQMKFFSSTRNLGQKEITHTDQTQLFLQLSDKLKCITQCNEQAFKVEGLRYKILVSLRNLENQIKLAEILFLYTFSPYQLFYLNTSSEILHVLLTVFWPLALFILLLKFVLLTQQYSIGVIMVEKKLKQIFLKMTNLSILEIKYKNKKITINDIFNKLSQDDNQNIFNFRFEQKHYKIENLYQQLQIKFKKEISSSNQQIDTEQNDQQKQIEQFNLKHQIQEEQNQLQEQFFSFSSYVICEKKIDLKFQKIFFYTQILEIICSVTIIINLIFTYGSNLIDEKDNKQQLVTIIATFVFVLIFIVRNLFYNPQIRQIIMMIFIFLNLLITTIYSEMYHLLRITIKRKEYRRQIKNLSQYLTLNIIFLIIFYIIETQMNFDGYIYSIIIFYNLSIYIIDSIILLVALLKEKYIKSKIRNITLKQNQINEPPEKFYENYQDIIAQYLKDLSSNQTINKEKNQDKIGDQTDNSISNYDDTELLNQELIEPDEIPFQFYDNDIKLNFDSFNDSLNIE